MARTITEVQTAKSPSEIEKIAKGYLSEHKFKEEECKGEKVWRRGSGILTGPLFLKVTAQKGKAVIEAWMKFALLPFVFVGEMGTEGAFGGIPKRMLKKRVEELQQKLAS